MAVAERAASPPQSDDELIARVEAGEQEAFGVLYERYFPRVFHFVQRRMGNRADLIDRGLGRRRSKSHGKRVPG